MNKIHRFEKISPNAYNHRQHLTPEEAKALLATGNWEKIQFSHFRIDKDDSRCRIVTKMMNAPSFGDIETVYILGQFQEDPLYYSNREKWQGYGSYGWLLRPGSYREATPDELKELFA